MNERLIRKCDENGDFVTDVDGFVKFWPSKGGCLEAHDLRAIADELDKRNAAWVAQINAYFDTNAGDKE